VPIARAVRITGSGGPETLSLGELEVRSPGPSEVLVAVRAAGLNRADVIQRRGFYPAPRGVAPDVPGLEFAGNVIEVGADVVDYVPGDRVMAITAGAAMASYVVAHERELMRMPEGMSFEDAAAIPEVFLTVYDALVTTGGLRPSQTVLLHAVGSGIGTAAIQLTRAYQAIPIGTSRTKSKLDRCMALGLAHGIEVREGRFAEAVKSFAPKGADLVLDTVGAAYLEESVAALAQGGTIIGIGLVGGVKGTLPLGAMLAKRAVVRGSTLRARPIEEKIALAQAFSRDVLPLFSTGVLKPVVDAVMPITAIREAHARMDANDTFGKLVMRF
jgi:NADPH:quinone reductase